MEEILDSLHEKIGKAKNKNMLQHIQNYNFYFITKIIDIDNEPQIYQDFKESKSIIINYYEYIGQDPNKKYIFIGFKNSIIIILKENLSFLQSLFSNNFDVNICFLSGSKNHFDQHIHINYKEIEFDLIFQTEIQNFELNLKLFELKGIYFQIWKCIRPCISGYLIKQAYSKLTKDRFFNASEKVPVFDSIKESDYIFLRVIGEGSIFRTDLIYHICSDEIFALKKVNINDNETGKLIEREIDNYGQIKHQFIPKFYGTVKKLDYLVIEYIHGETLKNIKNLSIDEKITIIFELMIILEFLHRNHFIYRDLKPNNVMIDKNKTVVLIDFDRMINADKIIDCEINNQNISKNFASDFVPPEINSTKVSYKSDTYSLGKMIYYIIKEKYPNQNDEFFENLPEIGFLYKQMTNENPNERPSIFDVLLIFYIIYYQNIKIKEYFDRYFGQTYGNKIIEKLRNIDVNQLYNAIFLLGEIYENDECITKDINKSIYYYNVAANNNNPKAQYKLAKLYCKGKNVEKDINKSIYYYTLAANQNYSKAQHKLGSLYFNGDYVSKDIEKGIYYYTLAAKQNNSESLYDLAVIHISDKYNKKDIKKAIDYYQLAADLNYSEAQYSLGVIYEKGMHVMQDINKALKYYLLAAEKNHPEALFNLGTIYFEGKYVTQDINKAIYYYKLAAERNDPDAQLNLGLIYDINEYVPRDVYEAIHYYKLAADNNNAIAQYNLGVIYSQDPNVPRNINKAIEYYLLAGSQNDADAYYRVALLYSDDYSVKDENKAIYYYKLAANLNHPISQYNIGVIYSQKHLISKHINEVIHYYSLAAKNGVDQAQYNLAVIYTEGLYVTRDIDKAIYYYKLASDQHFSDAQYNLGVIYDEAKYVERNINKAIHYYSLAANQNHSHALYNLGVIYYDGKYIKEDKQKGLYYFTLAANQNNANALYNLGVIYTIGEIIPKDISKAIYYYSKSAIQNSEAQYILGIVFYEGVYVQKNINKSLNLLMQSSNNGNIFSHFILGFIYQIENDVKKDNEKAIHYYKLASSFDFQYAKHNLAIIYKNKFDDDDDKKNIWFSIELFKEAIRQKNDILSKYNLAKLYIFKRPIKDSFDEAIKLLLSSCDDFKHSFELLAFALLLKYDFDGCKIENEILNNPSYKNYSDSILKTIKKIICMII